MLEFRVSPPTFFYRGYHTSNKYLATHGSPPITHTASQQHIYKHKHIHVHTHTHKNRHPPNTHSALYEYTGPLPKTLVDFWRLVWQERPPSIVMITNLEEGGKIKCQRYWPESGRCQYGLFEVTLTDEQIMTDYTIKALKCKPSAQIAELIISKNIVRMRVPSRGKMAAADTIPVGLQLCNGDVSDKIAQNFPLHCPLGKLRCLWNE